MNAILADFWVCHSSKLSSMWHIQGKYCPSNKTRIPKQQSSSLLLVYLCPLCSSEYLVACSSYVPLLAGSIKNWRLPVAGDKVDDLLASPYYTKSPNSPKFNKLFAALYNL